MTALGALSLQRNTVDLDYRLKLHLEQLYHATEANIIKEGLHVSFIWEHLYSYTDINGETRRAMMNTYMYALYTFTQKTIWQQNTN